MKIAYSLRTAALLAWVSIYRLPGVTAKAVFAHYTRQVGTVDSSTNHAATDIDGAIAAGLDAFALNVGAPTLPFANDTLAQLFENALGKPFGLFFSFDLYSSNDIDAHMALYDTYRSHPNYYKVGNQNLLSTYGGASNGPDFFTNLKSSSGAYLVPDVDSDPNYYSNPSAFFSAWSGALDGVFSWETAWPAGSDVPVNTSTQQDSYVQGFATSSGKAYMIGLSPLQYKHCCDATPYYRVGEINLPMRMEEILSMQPQPDYAEVITWNDGGESHYIGPVWPEGTNAEIQAYGNSDTHPHDGWQGLVGSFADAFKRGVGAGEMVPHGGSAVTGAMWYRGVLKSCPGEQPSGAGAALDAVNYAVVLPAGSEGYTVRVCSDGQEVARDAAAAGLNYRAVEGMQTGSQRVEVLDGQGSVVASAESAVDVIEGPDGDFCNFNYYVVGMG